jgi:hypothetical protein
MYRHWIRELEWATHSRYSNEEGDRIRGLYVHQPPEEFATEWNEGRVSYLEILSSSHGDESNTPWNPRAPRFTLCYQVLGSVARSSPEQRATATINLAEWPLQVAPGALREGILVGGSWFHLDPERGIWWTDSEELPANPPPLHQEQPSADSSDLEGSDSTPVDHLDPGSK